ncbi:MAG: AMP-binding protein [Saprospiraceae bacterium]
MTTKVKTYRIDGIDMDISMAEDISQSASGEQKKIAKAILDWNYNEEFTFLTSGSTGPPKLLVFTKDQIKASIYQSQQAFELLQSDNILLCLPMKYVAGKMMLYRALHLGMNVITAQPKIVLQDVMNHSVSFAAFIPLQVEVLLGSKAGAKWFSSIKNVIIGGADISISLEKKLATYANNIYHTYGMTETLTHIAIRKLSIGGLSYFQALPNISLSQNDNKTLMITAHHLNVQVKTHDVVDFLNDKSFRIKGRIDNVINSGGLKIYPEELEAIFKKYIETKLVVIGESDNHLGERVILVVESQSVIDPEWIRAAQSELPKNKWPKKVKYLDELPLTENGKIKRKMILGS